MNQWMNWTDLFGGKRRARSRMMMMDSGVRTLGYLGLGAGLMYFLDPDRGRRRRALVRDKAAHAINVMGCAADKTARDLNNRVHGIVAEASHLFRREDAPDPTLKARVRSKLGRLVSHPHAIEVTVNRGVVTLSGPVLASEVKDLLKQVSKIPGVREVRDRLTAHTHPGDVPGLQGGRERVGNRWAFAQTNWSPTARLMACATGGALMINSLMRRDPPSAILGVVGSALFLRGATNMEMKRLLGVGVGSSAIEIHKTINIDAPVERVYQYFNNPQNFPRFMTNVREVRPEGDGRLQWKVAGPMGLPVKWAARITENIPNERISWKTVPGSLIKNSGTIHFQPNSDGGTQVDIKLLYNPIMGAAGHAVAKMFDADPKSEMDEDLLRMKTTIETGHAPHDAAKPMPPPQVMAQRRVVTGAGQELRL